VAPIPSCCSSQARVVEVLRQEEVRFFETIEHGMGILEGELAALAGNGVFNGQTAFKLHDTFGFPLDLTADVCRERGVRVDVAAFDAAMAQQKEQARAAGKFRMAAALEYSGPETAFHGYEALECNGSVLALYRDGSAVEQLGEGELGVVVLDETPFYAESGGQVGDRGALQGPQGIFAVEDTQKIQAASSSAIRESSGPAASASVTGSRRGWTSSRAPVRCATTRRRT
jgi:alanyl-tRNA synthetase